MATAYSLISTYDRKKRAADEAAERSGRAIAAHEEALAEERAARAELADAIRRIGRPVLDVGAYPRRMFDLDALGKVRVVELAQAHDEVPVPAEVEAPPDLGTFDVDPDDDAAGAAAADDGPAEGPLDGGVVVPDQAVSSLAFEEGDEVEACWLGTWKPGVVQEVHREAASPDYRVSSDSDGYGKWFAPNNVRARTSPAPADGVDLDPLEFGAGDDVEILWSGGWAEGEVLRADPSRRGLPYLVAFDAFADGLWFSPDDVRARPARGPRLLEAAEEVFGGVEPAPVPAGYDPLHVEAPPVAGGAPVPFEDLMAGRDLGPPVPGPAPLPRPCGDCGGGL